MSGTFEFLRVIIQIFHFSFVYSNSTRRCNCHICTDRLTVSTGPKHVSWLAKFDCFTWYSTLLNWIVEARFYGKHFLLGSDIKEKYTAITLSS